MAVVDGNTTLDVPDDDPGQDNPSFRSTSDPDVILRPPITSQPSMTSLCGLERWTYTPSGPAPLPRPDYYGSSTSVSSEVKVRPAAESRDTVSLSGPLGSRDWSRELFGAFTDARERNNCCGGWKLFCSECVRVPCMMCDIAQSLGDKSYLPFIPGTGAAIRFKVRILGGIQGSICDDCVVTSCCCPCAVCQMYREIDDIGLGTS